MKLKLFIVALLFSLSTFTNASVQNLANLPKSPSKVYESFNGTTTYERVNVDGVWWIIVYEDGVKTQTYLDPDQSD